MGLAAPFTGEAEISTVAGTFEPLANVNDAAEALFLGILSTLIEAVWLAQSSAVARNRLAERLVDANGLRVCPNIAELLTWLGSRSEHLRRELRLVTGGPSDAQLLATDGEAHDFALNGPIH